MNQTQTQTKTKTDWRERLASMALSNVYLGGASAMVIIKRMDLLGLPGAYDAGQIVDYVYLH